MRGMYEARVVDRESRMIYTNPEEPGPIYLQRDYTTVAYRNIYLEPVCRKGK